MIVGVGVKGCFISRINLRKRDAQHSQKRKPCTELVQASVGPVMVTEAFFCSTPHLRERQTLSMRHLERPEVGLFCPSGY